MTCIMILLTEETLSGTGPCSTDRTMQQQQQPAGGGVTFFIEIRLPWRHPIKVQRRKRRVSERAAFKASRDTVKAEKALFPSLSVLLFAARSTL